MAAPSPGAACVPAGAAGAHPRPHWVVDPPPGAVQLAQRGLRPWGEVVLDPRIRDFVTTWNTGSGSSSPSACLASARTFAFRSWRGSSSDARLVAVLWSTTVLPLWRSNVPRMGKEWDLEDLADHPRFPK